MAAAPSTRCALVLRASVASRTCKVGLACLAPRRREALDDAHAFQLGLFQFDDVELANLESALVRVCADVVHHHEFAPAVAESSSSNRLGGWERTLLHKLATLLEVLKVDAKPHKAKKASTAEIEADLSALLGAENFLPLQGKVDDKDWNLAFEAASLLCRKEGLLLAAGHNEDNGEGYVARTRVDFLSLDSFVRLDSASFSSLNLLPGVDDRNKEASLHGVLDKTVTKKIGSRLLTQWIRQPLVRVDDIRRRHNRVEVLFTHAESREALRSLLKSVPDLDAITRRMQASKATLEDLYLLYLFVGKIPAFVDVLEALTTKSTALTDDEVGVPPFSPELATTRQLTASGKFGQYKEFIETLLDLDLAPREYLIRPEHDDTQQLGVLMSERKRKEGAIDKLRAELLDGALADMDAKWENDPRMIKTHGHHFRVGKKNHEALKRVRNGTELIVVTSCIRWSTPQMLELSSQLGDIVSQQRSVQNRLAQEALEVASSYLPVVEMSASIMAGLDVVASFAHVAATCPRGNYTRPEMDDSDEASVFVPQARHPCLELQPEVDFVPNTHDMNRERSRLQILTGPNMGGKSTYAKQLGVICVMAQIGSFVPSSPGAKLPVVDAVLARVGAGDVQLRGISTFMAEMIEAANIVKTCTNRSLVIIDELGRGTSTYDGFGLAWAICEFLANERRAFCTFATHFHELTVLEGMVKGVCNLHVAVAVQPGGGKVTMLHEVRAGRCDESFGVNIASVAGFPGEVIADATQLLENVYKFKDFMPSENDLSQEALEEEDQLKKRLRMAAAGEEEGEGETTMS